MVFTTLNIVSTVMFALVLCVGSARSKTFLEDSEHLYDPPPCVTCNDLYMVNPATTCCEKGFNANNP